MKTIYNRLKPEILVSINKDEQEFPYTTKALIKTLKATKYWDDLTISDIRAVVIHSHISIIDIQQEDIPWGGKFLNK